MVPQKNFENFAFVAKFNLSFYIPRQDPYNKELPKKWTIKAFNSEIVFKIYMSNIKIRYIHKMYQP